MKNNKAFNMLMLYIIFSSVIFHFYEFLFKEFYFENKFFYKELFILIYILSVGLFIYFEVKEIEVLKNKIQDSKQLFETLINLSLDGIYVENERGEILACNRSGHEMFGYTKEEMLTKSIKDLVPEEFAKTLPEIIPEEMASKDAYVERVNKKKDGTLFPTEINTKFIKVKGERRLLAYVRNISQRKEYEQKLRRLSIRDDLTKLYNRRYILELLDLEVEKVKRYNQPVSLAMLDIDDFKNVNDSYGHVFGDEVLKKFAHVLLTDTRKCDCIGRYGGEEFIIIFPNTDLEKSYKTLYRLKEEINMLDWGSKPLTISFSAGLVQITQELAQHSDCQQILSSADELLYEAKRAGKNRIIKEHNP